MKTTKDGVVECFVIKKYYFCTLNKKRKLSPIHLLTQGILMDVDNRMDRNVLK